MVTLTDLTNLSCGPDTPIREVLARINVSPYLFQVVLDKTGRLLGTVTDGDVRRGMLGGTTLEMPVRVCMRTGAISGRIGANAENISKFRLVGGLIAFLPVVDSANVVREILVETGEPRTTLTALVMAGGMGTRLGERTRTTPKPLLPIGEKPILGHVLERLEEAGIMDIYIAVHYLAEQIETFVASRNSRAKLHLIREAQPLGTAGALGKLDSTHDGPVLVMNSDVLTRINIHALLTFHHRHGYDGTIAVARYETRIPFGIVRHNEEGLFSEIEEKPQISHFVAAGIYCLSPEFTALVPPDKPMDMPELLNLGRGIGLRIGLFPIHEYWQDIGCPADLAVADEKHKKDRGDTGNS